jgi:myosin heavy subunit
MTELEKKTAIANAVRRMRQEIEARKAAEKAAKEAAELDTPTNRIRGMFDEIVALQKEGMQLQEFVKTLNDEGMKISLSHLRNIMSRIRKQREKESKKSSEQTAVLPAKPAAVAPAPVKKNGDTQGLLDSLKPAAENTNPLGTIRDDKELF